MKDAVPELLEQIRTKYRKAAEADPQRTAVRRRIGEKTSDMADIHTYAEGTGHALSDALTDVLTPENLPDGKLYYNIASRTITPMAREGYEEICEAAEEIQAIRDEKDGVHLNAVPADWPEDRVNGLADKAADAEDFRKWLEEPIVNLCESIADSFMRNNAEFRYKSGMSPKIRRDGGANCCEWCADLEDVYSFPNVPKEVWQRHEHCRCVVTYENGRDRQNGWSKDRWQSDPDELARRQEYGLEDEPGRSITNPQSRGMANGPRRGAFTVVTPQEQDHLLRCADDLGIPREILSFNTGFQTSFDEKAGIIHVRGDVFPSPYAQNINSILNERCALAHEYYGHYMHSPSEYKPGDWRDEFRASYRAALDTPRLTDKERSLLMIDAYERAHEAGISLTYSEEARRVLFENRD